ncbi:MAG TPA: hypothetical protein VFO49_08310 [Nocardioides sp.]|nr:hypothetical protein [Nocardioides sp.]
MSRRVFVHIGLPKTGTSYLQSVIWPQRDTLRAHGLLVPGREKRDHLFSSMIVRDDPGVQRRGPGADQAWDVVRREIAAHDGDALVSHEFFCAASPEQAERLVADLAPAEVHVIVTAREPLGLFTSSWQESLKNLGTTPLQEYGRTVSDDPRDVWDWRSLDLGLVLERWSAAVPDERLHLVVAPGAGLPREELWRRFAGVIGLDPDAVPHEAEFTNQTMGVVEAETLRRLNPHLRAFRGAYDRGRWIRKFLADERLVTRGGERYWPDDDQVADARDRGARAVERIRAASYDVVGEVDELLVPDELPPRRHPSSVTDAEVAEVAVSLVARLMEDVRERSPRAGADGRGMSHSAEGSRIRRLARRARRRA